MTKMWVQSSQASWSGDISSKSEVEMLPTSDADEGLKNLPLEVTTMLLHQPLKGLSASQGTFGLSRDFRPLKGLSASQGTIVLSRYYRPL